MLVYGGNHTLQRESRLDRFGFYGARTDTRAGDAARYSDAFGWLITFPADATIDRAAVEEEIRLRHVGQPIEEFARDGRFVTVAGQVENLLIRLL